MLLSFHFLSLQNLSADLIFTIFVPRKQLFPALVVLITAIFLGHSSLIKQKPPSLRSLLLGHPFPTKQKIATLSFLKMSSDPPPFEIPAVDEYAYRLIKLDNSIQALLISDPEADKAAAACDVRVGSMSDPTEFPGLAHFTEHMLFYSSKKYPEEDAYSKFISDHGGKTNAYTR